MKLVQSDSPEVANSIASTRMLASRGWSVVVLVCIVSAPGLLIFFIVSLIVSMRTAAWFGVPVVLALSGYLFWRGRSPRLNWVIAGCADQLFVRLFIQRRKRATEVREPDVIMFDASEIASMTVRTIGVFLYGPKPRSVEWLVIELTQAVADDISRHIRPLLAPPDPYTVVLVTNESGRLTMNWKGCRPALRVFLQQAAQGCPFILIAPEECSELDLNAIWHRIWSRPDVQERRMLVQAKRLGFGSECVALLSRHRYISPQKAAALLAELEQEETGTENSAACSRCRF